MKLNTDRIVSLSAMVVGIGSLFIIIYQTHLIRQAQNASVLPYLMIAIQSDNDGVHVVVSNAGIAMATAGGSAPTDSFRSAYEATAPGRAQMSRRPHASSLRANAGRA